MKPIVVLMFAFFILGTRSETPKGNKEEKKSLDNIKQQLAEQRIDLAQQKAEVKQLREQVTRQKDENDKKTVDLDKQNVEIYKLRAQMDEQKIQLEELNKEAAMHKVAKRQNDVIEATKKLCLAEIKKYLKDHRTCKSGLTLIWFHQMDKQNKVLFGRNFPGVPEVTASLYGFQAKRDEALSLNNVGPKASFGTAGYSVNPDLITTSSFTIDYKTSSNVGWVKISWMACY